MSGQLVGDVIAAAGHLRERGLSERGFYALIAIAEKCRDTKSRQASVNWNHIRAGLYGASKRTAERAVQDLKTAGIVVVLKPGFNNNHGRSCAPVYRIAPLTDADSQVSQSVADETDIQVSASGVTDTDKPGTDTDKPGGRYRHLDVVLDVPIDVPTDKRKENARGTRLTDDWMPPPELVAQMRSECPEIDLDSEHRKFIDHWMSVPAAKGRKLSWERTWRNWIRNARPTHQSRSGPTAFERKTAANLAVFRELGDEPPEPPIDGRLSALVRELGR